MRGVRVGAALWSEQGRVGGRNITQEGHCRSMVSGGGGDAVSRSVLATQNGCPCPGITGME
jgi:hypothetical protein